MSWTRKLLRVDLAKGSCTSEPLNMEWAKLYLGQRGLASKYLSEEVDPKCDPLGPDNVLVMAPGVPLAHPQPHRLAAKAQAAGTPIIGDIELFAAARETLAPQLAEDEAEWLRMATEPLPADASG